MESTDINANVLPGANGAGHPSTPGQSSGVAPLDRLIALIGPWAKQLQTTAETWHRESQIDDALEVAFHAMTGEDFSEKYANQSFHEALRVLRIDVLRMIEQRLVDDDDDIVACASAPTFTHDGEVTVVIYVVLRQESVDRLTQERRLSEKVDAIASQVEPLFPAPPQVTLVGEDEVEEIFDDELRSQLTVHVGFDELLQASS